MERTTKSCPSRTTRWSFCFARGAFRAGPSWFHDLVCAADGQGVFRNVGGDAGGGGNVGALADADGRDQGTIAADKDAIFDDGGVLVNSVIVASDGSGADVDGGADFCVAKVSKVVGLRSLSEFDFFGFHKIADVRAFSNIAAGAQVGIGAEDSAGSDAGFFENASGTNDDAVGDFGIANYGIGTD